MKYIDANKLRYEIERRNLSDYYTTVERYEEKLYEIIDSLEQDEPESSNSKFTFPNVLYARTIDNKTIDVSYTPQSLDAVEYIKNDQTEQPDADLKSELDEWMKYGPHKSYPWCTLPDIIKITAAHFYELGLKARKEE